MFFRILFFCSIAPSIQSVQLETPPFDCYSVKGLAGLVVEYLNFASNIVYIQRFQVQALEEPFLFYQA